MSPIIEQHMVTGSVKFVPYRALLDVVLTQDTFIVSVLGKQLAAIPITAIREIKLVRNVIMFGVKIRYTQGSSVRVLHFRTRRYKEWGAAFQSLDVRVIPHGGWFEFETLDYFRQ